jgi:hypothetical protein
MAPLPERTSSTPLAANERTASRTTVRETPNRTPRSRSDGSRSPGLSALLVIIWSTLSVTRSDRVGARSSVGYWTSSVVTMGPPRDLVFHHAKRVTP